jgi:hypothetical protein
MGERRGSYRVLVGKERRSHLEEAGVDGRIIIKRILENLDGGGGGMHWIDLAQDRDRWRVL